MALVLTLWDFPRWFSIGLAVVFGLLFGSFLNVVIYRLPRGESLSRPGSHCPHCGAAIPPWNNLPLLSWLLLRGRSSCCHERISARYPTVELLGGLLAWAVFELVVLALPAGTPWWQGVLVFFAHLALALGLLAAAWIDLDYMYLPDAITLGGAVLGLATVPWRMQVDWTGSLLGAAIGFGIVWLPFILLYGWLRGGAGMGLGDAKLTLLAGVWFGWPGAVFALLAGACQGTIAALVIFAVRGRLDEPPAVQAERAALRERIAAAEGEERARLEAEMARDPIGGEPEAGLGRARMAFGPFLILATLEFMLFGEVIVQAYREWAGL